MDFYPRQVPYKFRPPKHSALWSPVVAAVSDVLFLRHKFRVGDIVVEDLERVVAPHRRGHAVMVAANHADHADPYVLHQLGRRARLPMRFIAAREGFELGPFASFGLQYAGAFSIDRDGPDIAALRMAIDILAKRTHPLVIFPEGEIYHHQEQLDPLHDGFAAILLKALARLPANARALLVPCALLFRHPPEIEAGFGDRLSRLEHAVFGHTRPSGTWAERIWAVGNSALGQREQQFLGVAAPGTPLEERLSRLREHVLAQVAERLGVRPVGTNTPERLRSLKHAVRARLLAGSPPPSAAEAEALRRDMGQLYLATQLYSYPAGYLADSPSRDRLAETILKLEEDILEDPRYPCDRTAVIRFGRALDARDALEAAQGKPKEAIALLTRQLTEAIGALLAHPCTPTNH